MTAFLKLALLTLLISLARPAYIYFQGVQVDPTLVYQVQVACDRLQKQIQKTYGRLNFRGSTSATATNYYIRTFAANYFLKLLSNSPQIAKYNNVVIGQNVNTKGNRNIIIGNNANVVGNSNYVFSDTYLNKKSTPVDNSLILDEWLIKLILLNEPKYFENPKSYIYKH